MLPKNPRASYALTHWGRTGKGRVQTLPCADPSGDVVELGELLSCVYITRKGIDSELVEFEHEFEQKRPKLCYSESGLLLIAGGSYRVTARGIVG